MNFSQSAEETPRLEMTHRVLFEIIGNSSTVPIPEFQYCPDPVNEFSDLGTEASKPRARISGSGLRRFSAQVDGELTASWQRVDSEQAKLRFPGIPSENTVEFARSFSAL